jgi:hypothetical protein
MQHIRTQPAGPKAFRLYSMICDTYRQEIGERACSVYEALTYYVDPKTLEGTIPLKLLAETVQSPLTTVSRCLHRLWEEGLITITPNGMSLDVCRRRICIPCSRFPSNPYRTSRHTCLARGRLSTDIRRRA